MKRNTKLLLVACTPLILGALAAKAISATNEVKVTTDNGKRCIQSNGIPDHEVGQFPNKGNPNSIKTQKIQLCVTANPTKGSTAKDLNGTTGFALNGIIIRPGTADWYDGSSPRGHSRDRSSGWNLDGLGPVNTLGMDQNNAHVDNQGIYHYHGPSKSILNSAQGTLIGYSADGHELHYVGSKVSSSWQLKKGTRPSAPGGAYDGAFNQDWEYVAGSGTLDKCNGATVNGKYVYYATDSYPFFPRCAYGEVSSDFTRRGGQAGAQDANLQNGKRQGQNGQNGKAQRGQKQGNKRLAQNNNGGGQRRGPPQEAISACASSSVGNSCSFQSPRGNASGQCVMTPNQQMACRPNR